MRSILKKAFAAVLAASLCLSLAGCYDENNSWAAKKGEDTMPIGGYIYYLFNSYYEAVSKVPSDQEVLKTTIEDKDGQTWIKDKAMNSLKSFYYISGKFDELGLELTEEDQDTIQSSTDSMWSYYKSTLEALGVAKDSFNTAASIYNTKYQKVMDALYGEGGEMEIPEDELKSYFTENYYSYEYFYASLSTTDEEGNSVDLSEEEKEEVKSKMETYVDKINTGDTTVEDAASEYAEDTLGSAGNSTYQAPSPTLADNVTTTIKDALDGLEDNKAALAETTTGYYVVRKLPIADKFSDTVSDETQKRNLISTMKRDDFSDFVSEQAEKVEGLELNEKAIGMVKLSKLVNDSNKMGTSSASSTAEGGESSAAETSSTVESSDTAESSGAEESSQAE